jgi:hypothetical protein
VGRETKEKEFAMLTLVSRDLRRLTSAIAAVAIVSFGLLAVDQGHGRAVGAPDIANDVAASGESTEIMTLPEVVVVATRLDTR